MIPGGHSSPSAGNGAHKVIPGPQQPSPARWIIPAIYCGTLAAFVVDMTVVNTLPFGLFYVPLVGTAYYRRDTPAVWVLAVIACVLVFIGSFSPSIDPDTFEL